MKPFPPPLHFSIPTALLILGVALLGISLWNEIRVTTQEVRKERMSHARVLGTMVSGELESVYRAGQPWRARAVISRANGDRELSLGMLLDEKDQVISATRLGMDNHPLKETPFADDAPILHRARDTLTPFVGMTTDGERIIGVFPLFIGNSSKKFIPDIPEERGLMVIGYDLRETRDVAFNDAVHRGVYTAGILAGIWLLLGIIFKWAILKRVQQLVKVSQRFAGGDFAARAQLRGSDELAMLASTFNEMGERLEAHVRALQHSVKVRDEFLSIASHELKTPLTTIKMQTQLLLDHLKKSRENPDFAKPVRYAEKIDDYTRRLATLVNDILDVARISAGRLNLDLETIDLSAFLEEIIERAAPSLETAGITIERQIEGQVYARVDRLRIEDVVTNLLSNTIKYAAGRTVEIRLQSQGGRVTLSVRDHGQGIPPDKLEKIFDRFERVDVGATATRVSGLGLGLYISRQIVNAHHGKIWAESSVGHGSCFTVEIPVVMTG